MLSYLGNSLKQSFHIDITYRSLSARILYVHFCQFCDKIIFVTAQAVYMMKNGYGVTTTDIYQRNQVIDQKLREQILLAANKI